MQKERIEYVIQMLRQIPRKKWDYSEWASGIGIKEGSSQAVEKCRTVACAAGWMGLDPKCNAEGFTLELSGCPRYAGYLGSKALMEYLGIDMDDVYRIFYDLEHYLGINTVDVTPQHVEKALAKLIA